jgi:hypothetical protein
MKNNHFFIKKYFSPHHYIVWLKKQPAHMQHVYAAVFAGSVTVMLAAVILYFDYGFWHEKYNRNESLTESYSSTNTKQEDLTVQSPSDMIGSFLKEAHNKFTSIGSESKSGFLQEKETYIRGATNK